ncbi:MULTISPECIES: site-specific DNA-methyltransferase [Sphingobacterium]|uniref:site-specific DNA-methyltransferase n=1 Tax=Sphingobacterium TaxID=28453 RepID=UPI00257B325D|nr:MULTISPECIES: site-specific DNA-methyltransferase [Sphingobacterium]
MSVDKLDMQSANLVNQNIEKLAELFPNCVTESGTGKAIDFDLLRQELSHAVVEGNKERYRLEWPGKKEAIVTANLPTTKTLRPIREDSVDFDNTENIYIEGDNLEVLKLLQESYLGKIKMIYIDPPYNTGKDFVYKDNFAKDTQEELFEGGQKDEHNQRLVVNPETAGRYHSDWLSMMYPRLKLARNLLKEDGVIFISIDDNEVHNLRKICDGIFGEINFIGSPIWQHSLQPKGYTGKFSVHHNYTLIYSKSDLFQLGSLQRTEEHNVNYKNPDNDPKGKWRAGDVRNALYRPNLIYDLVTPSGKIILPPENGWRWSKETIVQKIASKEIIFNEDETKITRKIYLSELDGRTPETIWFGKDVGTTRDATSELKTLFDGKTPFDTPKPTGLLTRIMEISALENGDIVLDFYAGSSTLAQATMSYCAKHKIHLNYINVQISEIIDVNTPPGKVSQELGLHTMTDLGKERIRRAANKIKEETGAEIDYGFRVYRLDDSNMQEVYYKPQEYTQANLDLFADNVKSDRTAGDLLAQVMLDWGLPLSLKIERLEIVGKEVFRVAEDSLYACFDKGLDETFAKEIAKDKPLRVVFRDNGFKDDTAKVNVKQLLKQLSPETEMKVI